MEAGGEAVKKSPEEEDEEGPGAEKSSPPNGSLTTAWSQETTLHTR